MWWKCALRRIVEISEVHWVIGMRGLRDRFDCMRDSIEFGYTSMLSEFARNKVESTVDSVFTVDFHCFVTEIRNFQ
jgi:hypothetical protein